MEKVNEQSHSFKREVSDTEAFGRCSCGFETRVPFADYPGSQETREVAAFMSLSNAMLRHLDDPVYVSSAEAAEMYGVTLRRMQYLLNQGRVVRAERVGRGWRIQLPLEVLPGKRGPSPRKPNHSGDDFPVIQALE